MRGIDVRIAPYFPGLMLIPGLVFMIMGLVFVVKIPFIGIFLLLMSVIIFTTHYRLAIDLDKKTYHDYLWLMGLKSGERGAFDTIDYIFIKKVKVSQTMNSRVSSSTIREESFEAYLRFSESHKIHLLSKKKKYFLVKKLKPLAELLQVKIYDYSEGDPQEITAF